MGREFASATARWCHLTQMDVRPELVAICDRNAELYPWYRDNFPTVKLATDDYHELLARPEVDAVYCAVPHHLHAQFYCDIIGAGKHLMGEKPFGIDQAANAAILEKIAANPGVFVRSSSEFPFYPAVQRIGEMIRSQAFGRILEVNSGFLHSSDLDPLKPINWKRMIEFNGEYGCMGDLGLHACHMPLRAGWFPLNVRAILSNIVETRPDGKGATVPCPTWDNATLLCETVERTSGDRFPMTLKMQRIAPGEKDTWYLEVLGTKASARFSTKNPRLLQVMEYTGGPQSFQFIDMGYESAFPTITGGIFEFGFTDAIQQMWAAYLHELVHGKPPREFAGCVTPEETRLSHNLFTAALISQREGTVANVAIGD